jgi:molybdopterin-biosynthesis enzyme MoeA-like protein
MVQLPFHADFTWEDQSVFPLAESWVPIAIVNGNVHILPGVPGLFQGLLDGLRTTAVVQPRLAHPDGSGSLHRILFSTPLSESLLAEYLTQLAARVEPRGIKVGSYPRWGEKRNTVTLVGAVDEKDFMESLVPEVEKNVSGRRVMTEGEDDPPSDAETRTTTTSTTITGTATATSP